MKLRYLYLSPPIFRRPLFPLAVLLDYTQLHWKKPLREEARFTSKNPRELSEWNFVARTSRSGLIILLIATR